MLVPRCHANHKLWWETKLTTCCDCTVGKRSSEIWISIITHKSGINRGFSRQPGWMTDSTRMVPAVPEIVTFTPALLDIDTNTTFSPQHTSDASTWLLYFVSKTQTGKWQLSPTLMRFPKSFVSLSVRIVWACSSTCICICVVGLAELLPNAKGKTRRLRVILSSLPCDYRDFGQNEAVNEPQCCSLCGWEIKLIL